MTIKLKEIRTMTAPELIDHITTETPDSVTYTLYKLALAARINRDYAALKVITEADNMDILRYA